MKSNYYDDDSFDLLNRLLKSDVLIIKNVDDYKFQSGKTGLFNHDMTSIRCFKNGVLHNEHGPALILQTRVEWFYNGVYHRVNGPAVRTKTWNNEIIEYYFIDGINMIVSEWVAHPKVAKYKLESILNDFSG